MKMQIVGFEGTSGVGKTSGKAYEIGQLHTVIDLSEPFGDAGVSKGQMGTTYRCPLPLIMNIKHLQPPFVAEVEVRDVMKFGKREQEVLDIKPIEQVRKAA